MSLEDRRFAINPDTTLTIAEGLDLVLLSEDEVLVQYGTRSQPSELLRDPDQKGVVGRLVRALQRGPRSMTDLLGDVPPEDAANARNLVVHLVERGVLADVQSSPVDQYLSYTFTGDSHLGSLGVSLVGAGPIGARLASDLLQCGVGRVSLLDDRPVNALWHAFLPFGLQAQNGASAAGALARTLESIGKGRVEALEATLDAGSVTPAVRNCDLTIVALEQTDLRLCHLVNRICIAERKPWLLVSTDGNLGMVGPLFVPVDTACYNCFRVLADATVASRDMSRKYRQHVLERGFPSFFPGLPGFAEIVAGYASLAAVHFLLRRTSFALGRVMVLNFDRMLIDVEDVLKLPRCPVCGTAKSLYRPAFSANIVNAT